jgi:hypothetical protein
MVQPFTFTIHYTRTGNTLQLLSAAFSQQDSQSLINRGLPQFLHAVTFSIDKNAIVDTANNIVYVLYEDFSKKYYLTYLIDGKVYKQEAGLSDALGVTHNHPKENTALRDKLAPLNLNHYNVHVYKGLPAYTKFGYDCVFGVIALTRKN